MEVIHDRRGEREQLAGQALHLLGDLQARDAVAHQRLVHVEMEEADLGVGDLGERLAVHPDDLQEGDEWEAGRQDGGDVAQELHVLVGEVLDRVGAEPDRRVDPLDQRRLEAALGGGLIQRVGLSRGREQVLDIGERQRPTLARAVDLLQRVAAVAQAGDDPRVRGGRQGPAAVVLWDQAVAGPSPQGCRRDARAAGRLGERDLAHAGVGCSGHAATLSLAPPASSGGTASWTDPAASRALRPAASATALVVRPAAPRGRVSVHYGLVPRWVRAA